MVFRGTLAHARWRSSVILAKHALAAQPGNRTRRHYGRNVSLVDAAACAHGASNAAFIQQEVRGLQGHRVSAGMASLHADDVDPDAVLAKALQAEYDSQVAAVKQEQAHYEMTDAELAKRLQEEADVEAAFDSATVRVQEEEQVKQLQKQVNKEWGKLEQQAKKP